MGARPKHLIDALQPHLRLNCPIHAFLVVLTEETWEVAWLPDPRRRNGYKSMSERSGIPLAVAIMGMSLAVLSYAIKDDKLGSVVYASGLLSAGFSLLHWFATPTPKRR